MTFIAWNDRLSVEVASMDSEHKELIAILNDLYKEIDSGAARNAVSDTLNRLTLYTEHLKDWLFDHILGSDRNYIEHLHAAGVS